MTKEEQIFCGYCNTMMRMAIQLFDSEFKKYGIEEVELGQGINFLGEPHAVGNAWLSEPYGIYAKARNPKSGEDETVQITICPAEGWTPIVTVSSTVVDPIKFEVTGTAEKDFATIQETLTQCLRRINAGS